MNTNELTRERISALADGELDDAQIDVALAALRGEAAHADWALYHQIGDVLRSDDMAVTMSSGFSSRLSRRLEEEPTFIAPPPAIPSDRKHVSRARIWRNSVAAAAMATFAFIATPPLLDALQGQSATPAPIAAVPPVPEATVLVTTVPDGVVLRDPRIDDYLHAHQRFSPSFYDSAQNTRNATFSGK